MPSEISVAKHARKVNLDSLIRKKIIGPLNCREKEFLLLHELVDRDLSLALNPSLDRSWRFIIAYNALAGMGRLVIIQHGYRKTGKYGNTASLDLLIHFGHNNKYQLPEKVLITQWRKRRNQLVYNKLTDVSEGDRRERAVLDLAE
jgi:hypothetical protein